MQSWEDEVDYRMVRQRIVPYYQHLRTKLFGPHEACVLQKNKYPYFEGHYVLWINPKYEQLCPKSSAIIESLPDVKIAMFSVLKPGAKILPHRGLYKGCLRYHLGLVTPNSNDCFISVNNIKYSWRDGKGILLDDTFEHWVENNTDKVRIILFCDIIRPMGNFGMRLNTYIMDNFATYTTRGN